jgi:hypothetical protein
MLCKSRVAPIEIEKYGDYIKCEINGLYLDRDLNSILKDLEEVFGCYVYLTIDNQNKKSENIYHCESIC